MGARLNVDVGELADEPPELVALASLVNVACGGHAGDEATMRAVCARARSSGAGVGAHPSYEDRAGFGRRALDVPASELRDQVRAQCARLAVAAAAEGVAVTHVKPHGALYHRAVADPVVAEAVLAGAADALGPVAVVGPPKGALHAAAARRGLAYLREGFADRGLRPDGSLVPRGEPGARLEDPAAAAAQALRLAAAGHDTICVHGDASGAVAIARAVRRALDGHPG